MNSKQRMCTKLCLWMIQLSKVTTEYIDGVGYGIPVAIVSAHVEKFLAPFLPCMSFNSVLCEWCNSGRMQSVLRIIKELQVCSSALRGHA